MKYPVLTVLLLTLVAGCGQEKKPDASYPNSTGSDPAGYGSYYGTEEITFLNEASSNASLDTGLTSISFVASTGEERLVKDIAPGKTLVLVVTRGNTVPICPYCSTQTARLISNYEAFKERGAEVAVVYPIETGDDRSRLDSFLSDVKTKLADSSNPVPFPVLLDVELKGVDQLGIRKDLSKPATYIVDHAGNVQYAYVGEHIADRPSVPALLAEVDKLKPSPVASPEPTGDDEASQDSTPKSADESAAEVKPAEDSATE
ncbi:MAG: redoxin domain-containing protein [Planctomycetota bacterium]|nr:redoxin domain-containing protein [Planctomycetota bacterium]